MKHPTGEEGRTTIASPPVVPGWRQVAGRAWRALRTGIEAWRHPSRRRKAREALRAHGVASRVVTVCVGNICRSPYAAASLRRRLIERGMSNVEVLSAGLVGPGRPVPPTALEAAGDLETDLRAHSSRLVAPDIIRPDDLVLVMAEDQVAAVSNRLGFRPATLVLGDLDPEAGQRTITDPWGGSRELFHDTFRRIDRCLAVIVEEWTG